MRNAVIVVHGISPHQRYEIQDAFACGLQAALQAETPEDRLARLGAGAPRRSGSWTIGIAWPLVCEDQPVEESPAVALRVECKDDKGASIASEPVVDVFEGYWSPIDKEQTNPLRVLSWLFQSLLMPLSNVKIPATVWKAAYDLAATALVMMVGLVATISLFSSASRAYSAYITHAPHDVGGLLIVALGAYVLAQVAGRLWRAATMRAGVSWWGAILLVLLTLLGLALVGWPTRGMQPALVGVLSGPRIWLLTSGIALGVLLSFAKDFLVDTIGDIQIYTTHDENARFYHFRRQIIQTVGDVVVRVLRTSDAANNPFYDKIFLVGHSLGTTVQMDVIVALHELVEEEGLSTDAWRRIRAFVTFGTALEKTRFFFDVRNENLSATLIRWRKDVYGHLFTSDASVLGRRPPALTAPPNGIFWTNYWYFTDVVANEIVSYVSSRRPGEDLTQSATRPEHPICVNVRLKTPPTIWPHSHYLRDASFWHSNTHLGVAAIVAHE